MTTWNPADKSANITLTSGNLAVGASTSADGGVRSTTTKSSGKSYFEVTWAVSSFGGDTSCGIATAATSLTSLGPSSNGGLLVYSGAPATIWFNGSSTGISIGNTTTSSVVCFAIDLDNSRAWARINGGIWNNSGTANPATNTGGVNIAALFPTNGGLAVVTMNQTNNPAATANFGGTAFAQTVPGGFSGWDAAAAAAAQAIVMVLA